MTRIKSGAIARMIAPLFITGAAAAGIALAPAAAANPPYCEPNVPASMCQQQGHSSTYTGLGDPAQSNSSFGWFLGTPPVPPGFAMN